MKSKIFLSEGRVEEFKQNFANKFSQEELQRIVNLIPPKFLTWVGNHMSRMNFDENIIKINSLLEKFEKISSNLPKTDLNNYKNIDELKSVISEYEGRSRRDIQQVEGGNVVYDDGRFFVVNPLSHQSSCYYGRGTKWCTASSSDDRFNQYNSDGKLFYVLDRTLPTDNPYYKVAILKKFDGDTSYWDAQDNSFRQGWIFGNEKINEIVSSIDSYMKEQFSEQIKIFTDKELARKEREKIERLRIQREKDRKRSEAQERRLNNEWDLSDPNIPEEGLKAHALLDQLNYDNEVEVLSAEDVSRIREIKNQIEELNVQYDEEEEPNTNILNRISELEDELEEYSNKIDVYNIIPDGEFYEMTRFEVIDSPVEGNEYAVGTSSEVDESVNEYVEGLIDDIGYEGFSKGFVESHIDEDEVADHARQTYEYDVEQNPESYLDDSDRELSYEQQDKIESLREKNQKLEQIKSNYEDMIENTEDEGLIEKLESQIEEIEDLIIENNDEIEEIEENPDGDYNQDAIDEKVESMVRDVRNDPMWYINELGLDVNDFVDRDSFIKDVVDSDGYGIINGYNGSYDEQKVNDEWYYVMRIN